MNWISYELKAKKKKDFDSETEKSEGSWVPKLVRALREAIKEDEGDRKRYEKYRKQPK